MKPGIKVTKHRAGKHNTPFKHYVSSSYISISKTLSLHPGGDTSTYINLSLEEAEKLALEIFKRLGKKRNER